MPEAELDELAGLYQAKGLTADTARQVATELTRHDALAITGAVGAHIGANPRWPATMRVV